MLVLSRKIGQSIVVGDGITVVVNRISGNRVSIAIEAPDHVRIMRGELAVVEMKDADQPNVQFPFDESKSPGSNAVAAGCD
jgi:carbon storage regulator